MSDERVVVMRIIDRLNVGGPAIHAVVTSAGLDPLRFRTVLVTGAVEPNEADMAYLAEGRPLDRVFIPSLGREIRPLRDLVTLFRLYQSMREVRPDVVHTHKSKAGTLGRMAALLARVPVRVHTFHGHTFHGYFGAAKTKAFLLVERALARATSRIVTLTPSLRDELVDTYRLAKADRFSIISLGFDLSPFRDAEKHRGSLRRLLGLSASTRLVGIVGRLVPVKDHRTFIAACARLAARHDDMHFVVVGGGELEAEVKAAVDALGITNRTHMLGWRRDLEAIYPDLDVLALSSINEGTPVTLIEGMSVGIPVAATAVGGVPDLLLNGERGELAPRGDAEGLACAIERALTPQARERAQRIRASILDHFDHTRLCRDLEVLYDSLLADCRRAA